MALKTINDLTALTTPASTDLIGVWNVSAGRMRKSTLAQVVTQAGVAAIKATANTFTEAQTITAASGVPLTLNTPASATPTALFIGNVANGSDSGPTLIIGRNNDATNYAAGSIRFQAGGSANVRYFWLDAGYLLRLGANLPTRATDTSGGSVVGDQTSNVAFKDIVGVPVSDAVALASVVAAAGDVRRFTYKNGAYNTQEFSGLIIAGDTLHRYGKDADPAYPAGKSLNEITLLGDLALAMRELDRRLTLLEA